MSNAIINSNNLSNIIDNQMTNEVNIIPLIEQSKKGNLKNVKHLVQANADIHRVDRNGMNALMYASQYNHNDSIVDFLIQSKANIDACDYTGMNALMYGSMNSCE